MVKRFHRTAILALVLAFIETPAHAEKFASIIIDDVGNNLEAGQQLIHLPATLTISILPRTTYAKRLARLANKNHKEVMLHLPMQSIEHRQRSPGTLGLHMTKTEFRKQLRLDLNAVPYIQGVNNHMGSLLTRHPGHMSWLMDELSRRSDLYFVDSKTTRKSIARKIAGEYNIPNLARDFFLDPDHEKDTLRKQFDHFIQKVEQRGYALAIAHPYPETINFLKAHLDELRKHGIKLIPVSTLVRTAQQLNKQREAHHVACTGSACSRL
jgi:polysaccharide deacetylase 2 family uncharacterized protein YibQ